MFKNAQEIQAKKENLKAQQLQKIKSECSFKPVMLTGQKRPTNPSGLKDNANAFSGSPRNNNRVLVAE